MKKLLLLLVLPLLALTAVNGQNRYDLNDDNQVNVGDISALYDYILHGEPEPVGPPVMYVHSELSWSQYAMYVWAGGGDVKDKWPGVQPSSTITIDGVDWMKFEMDEIYSTTAATNWIINNNGGGSQYDLMQEYTFSADSYVYVAADGSFTVDSKPFKPEQGETPGEGTPVTLSIDNTKPLGSNNRVIYELNVGSFTQAGTLAAAQAKLDDLSKLGVGIVWLMPIYPRGGGLNSPYAATDFKAVKSSYGTVTDLKNFVTRAHQLGMEVWLDLVPNHTATNHRWVTEHPEYYVTSNGSIVHPKNYSDVYQLNYNNSALVNAMNDCLKYWIDQADIDGYRCDYVSSSAIPESYWSSAIPLIKNYKAGKTISFLGEADFVNEVTKLKTVGFNYDFAMNFCLDRLQRFGTGATASTLKGYIENYISESESQSFYRMTYLTNHDVNYNDGGKTLASMFGDNKYAMTVVLFTAYGMPLLYNGQETGNDQKLDYFIDTKINWNSVDAKMVNTIRVLTALHNTQPALAENVTDITFHTSNNSGVLAYTKTSGSNKVLVVLNFGTQAVQANVSGIAAGNYVKWLDSGTIASSVGGTALSLASNASISLPAKGYAVFVKQ